MTWCHDRRDARPRARSRAADQLTGVLAAPRSLVSGVMPFEDAALFLTEAVASVLGQTWAPLELVLVDDGGSDGSGPLPEHLARAHDCVRVVTHAGACRRGDPHEDV